MLGLVDKIDPTCKNHHMNDESLPTNTDHSTKHEVCKTKFSCVVLQSCFLQHCRYLSFVFGWFTAHAVDACTANNDQYNDNYQYIDRYLDGLNGTLIVIICFTRIGCHLRL